MRRPLILVIPLLCSLFIVSAASARTWYIKPDGTGDVPRIQDAIDASDDGDHILCAPGVYNWTNQGGTQYGMITMLRGVADLVFESEAGAAQTILDAQFAGRIWFFQGGAELTIDGFTFQRGVAPSLGNFAGAAFAGHLASPIVKNCVFRNNSSNDAGGAYWYYGWGSPQILNCLFENNSAAVGGAIFFAGTPTTITVADCTLRNNSAGRGGGIWAGSVSLLVSNCLIYDNSVVDFGGGINVSEMIAPTRISNSTFYGNTAFDGSAVFVTGGGVTVEVETSIVSHGECGTSSVSTDAVSSVNVSCCDITRNVPGDFVGDLAGLNGVLGNFSATPLFCSQGFDFTLRSDSPCAEGNHPNGASCGLIGARGVGCAVSPVEESTWGGIKALYVE